MSSPERTRCRSPCRSGQAVREAPTGQLVRSVEERTDGSQETPAGPGGTDQAVCWV